jgi:hypothetical protein
MIKAQRSTHSTVFTWPIARRMEARKARSRAPWLRALAIGLASLGSARVMPGTLDHARREPPASY